MIAEAKRLTFFCIECDTKLEEPETYQYGGEVAFACEKCVRNHYEELYRHNPSEMQEELRGRRFSAAASIKRNRRKLEKQAAKRA